MKKATNIVVETLPNEPSAGCAERQNDVFISTAGAQNVNKHGEGKVNSYGIHICTSRDDVNADDGCALPRHAAAALSEALSDNTPSSELEGIICNQLAAILESCQRHWETNFTPSAVLRQCCSVVEMLPLVIIGVMLLISCILFPDVQNIMCLCLFALVFAVSEVTKGYLMWAQLTETKYRTASVMQDVIRRWNKRIAEMPEQESLTTAERRKVFLQSFAFLPAKAFRMLAVVNHVTYRLKYVHKSLMVKGCKRLDEGTMRLRRYNEPQNICKLVDIMRIILESNAIVLKPLTDRAKPPRLPNLLISQKKFVEEEITTDESDGERDSRTAVGGGNSISVYQHMEYFIDHIFLLIWAVAMALTVGAGVLYYFLVAAPLWEGVFLFPSVALLGLLPVNAIVVNRALVLYANVHLEKLFHFIVAKRVHSFEDKLPHFSFWATLWTVYRIVLRRQPQNGGRNPLVFSNSLVDAFGMATVIAVLDQTGIVTDMVPVPQQILLLRVNPMQHSTSSEDDEGDVSGCLTERSKVDARERKREMKKQVRRKKFQDQRFIRLKLMHSTKDNLAVDFADGKQLRTHRNHLNPVCLCILMHVYLGEPTNLETWTERFRFCDRSQKWARGLHWVPRASGFDDDVVRSFKVVARIFQINTQKKSGYRNSSIEQSCSILAKDASDMLHIFTMGTPFMVAEACTTHWTGTTVDEFDREEKIEVVHMGKHQWEQGMSQETVALSHRVLPERYRKYIDSLPSPNHYHEFFFRDGEEINRHNYEQKEQQQRRQAAAEEKKSNKTAAAKTGRGGGGGGGGEHQRRLSKSGRKNDSSGIDASSDDESRQYYCSCPTTPHTRHNSALKEAVDDGFGRSCSAGATPTDSHGEFEKDDCLTPNTFIYLMATCSHTFLGLVGLRDSIRPNIQETMSILDDAGVRCMYFCSGNEKDTKSFGAQVGLETDWNCCISLREGDVSLDPFSIRAQLPFGIKSIRKHILHVDPIPIQVNLFSHSQGVSKRAMLSILQDNHEIVIAVGSVFNHSNVRSFVQADLSVGVLPTRRGPSADKEQVLRDNVRIVEPSDFAATNSLNRDIPLYRNVAELIGCSCTLRAPPTTSTLPIMATMIKQARMRLSGIANCVEFILHASFTVVVLNVTSLIIGAPLMITPTVTVVVLYVIIPLLALSCTYTAYAGMDPMKTMTSRHNYFVRLAIFRHSATVWALRYLPSIAVLLVLGLTAGTHVCRKGLLHLIDRENEVCMSAAHGYVALTLSYWLLVHSWTHISRHHPIGPNFTLRLGHGMRSSYLFQSFRWLGTNVLVVMISVIVILLDTPLSALSNTFFPSPVHFVVSVTFPVVLLALDVPIKRWRERRFTNMQKFRKLSFGTRLGMHSPRGDYEPEGITYNASSTAAGAGAAPGEVLDADKPKVSVWKRIHEAFYRFASVREGRMELNCVCCDHLGGNYASYHIAANV